jgi:hypothetical protein
MVSNCESTAEEKCWIETQEDWSQSCLCEPIMIWVNG